MNLLKELTLTILKMKYQIPLHNIRPNLNSKCLASWVLPKFSNNKCKEDYLVLKLNRWRSLNLLWLSWEPLR